MHRYALLLEALLRETPVTHADFDLLTESDQVVRRLVSESQLREFQGGVGGGKLDWANVVGKEVRKGVSEHTGIKQSLIFDLIKGEMDYILDLQLIDKVRLSHITLAFVL